MEQLLNRTKGDKIIWGVVIVLSLISLLAVYSSTSSLAYRLNKGHTEVYLIKQLGVLFAGLVIIYFCHKVNYTVYSNIALLLFAISIPLLIFTLFYGTTLNEGSRWIRLPLVGITFQTSDLAKLGLFMFLARQLSKMQNDLDNLKKVFIHIFLPVIVICGLVAMANLSTALMIALSSGVLFFIGRVRISHLLILATTGILLFGILFTVSKLTGFGRAATWEQRIKKFTSNDKNDEPFQVFHSKIAIAKGGLTGKGAGNSTQRNFLPHPYSDFIFAIIIEEYGLVGGIVLIFLYLLFLWRSIVLFRRCPFAFGAFLAVGLSFTLVFQAFLNMGVNVNLLPVTGLTLPLVSMGGSSIWFTCVAIGIILSVSRFVEEEKKTMAENVVTANLTSNNEIE
ncbi:MAG: FtsW/RodA/SpoVE family cell cycle protein [Bacteroidetes bacterium]|nr:FtsW/RodA/SpoVE family cell cycle protein [Bacteroidota bacterium]MBK6819980.1 FtsW/RodA/SpoVE family cell cycle protein [Bacteroidota bacterium]MBK9482577.1 FtsW/RodA/SpoVE family cell cycle protein [Bacteroidota bacterium]